MTVENENMPTAIETAKAVRAELQAKLDQTRAELADIDKQRAEHAYGAHTGNDVAKKTLEKLNRKRFDTLADIEGLETAIQVAGERVKAAERDAKLAELEAHAERAMQIGAGLVERGRKLDQALAIIAEESRAFEADLRELNNRLGCSHPSENQLAALGTRAFKAALMFTPLQLEHLAPHERGHKFTGLASTWSETIARWASPYLPKKEEAA